MQSVLQHCKTLILPFNCAFSAEAPVHPELCLPKPPKPPPDLPLEIWWEIFQFATYIHYSSTVKPMDPFTPCRTTTNANGPNTPYVAMKTKLSLVLVSKSWRKVGIRLLYQHLVIRSPARANALLQVLESSKTPPIELSDPVQLDTPPAARTLGYGEWTRHVEVLTHVRGSRDIRFLQTTFQILRNCVNLQMLSGRWMHGLPIEFLNGVAGMLGPRLSELYWNERTIKPDFIDTLSSPEFLGAFRALRVLDLRHWVGKELDSRSPDAERSELPFVQDLILSTHPRSLQTATILKLPRLSNLSLRNPAWKAGITEELLKAFLKAHGAFLSSIDLSYPLTELEVDVDYHATRKGAAQLSLEPFLDPAVCPNLETLTFSTVSPRFGPETHHPTLRRIALRGVTADCLYPDKQTQVTAHLKAIDEDKFPRLELVQLSGFLVEAHTDSVIKDVCIWWVEHFEKKGVDFLDGEGVLWAYSEPEPEVGKTAEKTSKEASSVENSSKDGPCLKETSLQTKEANKKAKIEQAETSP
ncbi:unnamed protein product [Cyclocybe aegerita]|uniref:F-box domain-containing protein n=1 Tax=Cyclocybe aegerita TaxID=1973307 RepID=A0A8S0XPC0_CYCAE|nr:unnamed protein product [Cyclocybe aegerita]